MNRYLTILTIQVGMLVTGQVAHGRILSLTEIDELSDFISCRQQCDDGALAQRESCYSACPAENADWEKNGVPPVDIVDKELALLEFWDNGTLTRICYEEGYVVPAPLCGFEECVERYSEAECADTDGDGLAVWQETIIGTSDAEAQIVCEENADCGSFDSRCNYIVEINASVCMPRECADSNDCTAFHLEQISADNSEVIVHVHLDYLPTTPRILDLYIKYDSTALKLIDSRRLEPLKAADKTLTTTYPSKSQLRLVVYGATSTSPILEGAIVELVFMRITTSQSNDGVAFVTTDYNQSHSVAPYLDDLNDDLMDDALWGNGIDLAAADPNGDRLLLHYSFDNIKSPLDYDDVKDGAALCALFSECNNLGSTSIEQTQREKMVNQLDLLQSGSHRLDGQIEGVWGKGGYFSGLQDHLALPVTLNDPASGTAYQSADQSFSLSTWFYVEDSASTTEWGQPQLLFAHSTVHENTRFGVVVEPMSETAASLIWFSGNIDTPTETVISDAIPIREWTHIGMTMDAASGVVEFYINGEKSQIPVQLAIPPDAIQCPGFNGTDLSFYKEGELSGRTPETLYYASAKNNLYGIEAMDLSGVTSTSVLRSTEHSIQDPDYYPPLDKLVFSSNESGDFEIWIADGDGSNARQITTGFGDTDREIFARRPKWAPDGSAIVFESNAYSLTAGDNTSGSGYHLYYIEYDTTADQVTIPLAGGGTANALDYDYLIQLQNAYSYRLTQNAIGRTHREVTWLQGHFTEGDDTGAVSYWGEIVFNTANANLDSPRISRIKIPEAPGYEDGGFDAQVSEVALGTMSIGVEDEVRKLAAFRIEETPEPEISNMLLKKSWASLEDTDQYHLNVTSTSGGVKATITYTPSGYEASCWDKNRDNIGDEDEDLNGDGEWNTADCFSPDVQDIYLTFDHTVVSPVMPDPNPITGETKEEVQIGGVTKYRFLQQVDTADEVLLKVEILSTTNNIPIPSGAVIAEIDFEYQAGSGAHGVTLKRREVNEEFYIKDLTDDSTPKPLVFTSGQLSQILSADYAPDGDRLVLAGIENARPVLVTTDTLVENASNVTTDHLEKVSMMPMSVQGLSWKKIDRYYPCNWVGAFRDKNTKRYKAAFTGGLDEFKMYSYVRSGEAFKSDAERGFEMLEASGGAQAASKLPTCTNSDLECPDYHLCEDGQCVVVACDPDDPYSCERGVCTLAPVTISDDDAEVQWACASECNVDKECYEQECLNGPCRFCDDNTQSCFECQERTDQYDTFSLTYIEGCPDRNSFSCEEGSCLTECYATENGESKYLCEPGFEYCDQGKCAAFKWQWADLAPATLSGLGEMVFDGPTVTAAIPQMYPITISAYGVGDYLNPPEILVEGSVSTGTEQVYAGDWFEIGSVQIYNVDKIEGEDSTKSYTIHTPYAITNIRLKLVTPPYDNMNASATGDVGDKNNLFCRKMAWGAPVTQDGETLDPCVRRASGSRANIGYPIGIPEHERRRVCKQRGGGNCGKYTDDDSMRKYIWGGQPAVIITEVEVNGSSVLTSGGSNRNLVCSYEGELEPLRNSVSSGWLQKKVYFGDAAKELSNQKEAFYPSSSSIVLLDFMSVSGGAPALLNCNFGSDETQASLELSVNTIKVSLTNGDITETADTCTVEVDQNRTIPCYEWMGGGVSLDVIGAESTELHDELEIMEYRSFGYDEDTYPEE